MLFSLVSCNGSGDAQTTSAPDTSEAPVTSDTQPTPPQNTPPANTPDDTTHPATGDKELSYKTKKLTGNTAGIKIIGVRNLKSDTHINADWSCSGIEFTINSNGGDIEFSVETQGEGAMFRVYCDGKEWKKSDGTYYYTVEGQGLIKMLNVTPGTHTIKVIKVNGYTTGLAKFLSVKYSGSILSSTPADKKYYIEFIGDSITCAWGTIGDFTGKYTAQDGTLAYSYLLAEKFDADYSMTALSGQGLLVGATGLVNGYKYACPEKNSSTEYGFARKADLTVINIGGKFVKVKIQWRSK